MSGSTIGGAVGYVVGAFFGPVGAQIGFMIGSAIGGYVDPTQVYGPRLSDLRGQTSAVGGAIPMAWGTTPVPCNIIWQQPGVTEHRHTDDGKGSGTEQVTFTYTKSYAVMYQIGEIAGVLQVKRNSKLVYDSRDDATLLAEYTRAGLSAQQAQSRLSAQRAENTKWLSKCTFYSGTQIQTADPTIESYKGVNNAPAYRGRAYMVVTDDDTQAGEIPQFEVVISVCGDVEYVGGAGGPWLATFESQGGNVIELSPDAQQWDSAASNVSGWLPSTRVEFYRSGQEVVLMASGRSLYTNDMGQTFTYTGTGPSFVAGTGVFKLGSYWHAANTAGTLRSSDGKSFTTNGLSSSNSISFIGTRIVAIRHSGDPGVIYVSDDYQDSWSSPGLLPNAFNPSANTRMASNGSVIGLICIQNDVSGSLDRVHILRTTDNTGGAWENLTSPFSDEEVDATCVHYSSNFGLWLFSFNNRLAYGPSPASLTLSPHIFSYSILSIDSGLDRLTVGLAGGGLVATSPDAEIWTEYEVGVVGSIFAAVSLLDPAGYEPIPDAPGFYVDGSGNIIGPPTSVIGPCNSTTIAEIVADVCELSGLTTDEYDVSDLTDTIPGFAFARETDGVSLVQSLQPIGLFDPAEWDAKFRGVKRGGTSVSALNADDLVERDGDTFDRELVQEVELLRRVTIGYIDVLANWSPNTQKWERRVGTINARGESTIEVSAVLEPDQAATIAKRRGMTAWGEPEKQKFSLPYRLAALTPTDVVPYTDEDGVVHYLRFMEIQDDSGVRMVESTDNCAEAYDATANGTTPLPPTIVDDSLRGPTTLMVMDLPLWRSSDPDDIGLYMAGAGVLGGWTGAQVDISLDGGVTYVQSEQVTQASVIGYTTTSLTAWASSENPEDQSVIVWLPSAPSSVTYEVLLTYANRAAVQLDTGEWEILQYQTVTALGDDLYTLSGLIRGRFNTAPGAVTAGADFVLLDSTVQFVTTPRDTLGETLTVRATSYGTSSDASVPFDFDFDDGFSQTEWPVHNVEAIRDSAGDILVSCIIRDRLGTEVTRFPSVHFAGLRFTYTDGVDTFSYDVSNITIGTSSFGTHEYTLAQQIADFGAIPSGGLTVTIAPLNDITGAGPSSAGVSV